MASLIKLNKFRLGNFLIQVDSCLIEERYSENICEINVIINCRSTNIFKHQLIPAKTPPALSRALTSSKNLAKAPLPAYTKYRGSMIKNCMRWRRYKDINERSKLARWDKKKETMLLTKSECWHQFHTRTSSIISKRSSMMLPNAYALWWSWQTLETFKRKLMSTLKITRISHKHKFGKLSFKCRKDWRHYMK